MKRLFRVLPAAVLLTAAPLAACGGDDDDDTPVTSVTSPANTDPTGTMTDNSGPATSGNDQTLDSGPDNGAGGSGTEGPSTEEPSSDSDNAGGSADGSGPMVGTTGG